AAVRERPHGPAGFRLSRRDRPRPRLAQTTQRRSGRTDRHACRLQRVGRRGCLFLRTVELRSFLCIAIFAAALPAFGQAAAGAATISLVTDGVERSYRLYVPAGYGSERLPLVLAFHGAGGSPEGLAELTGFDALADRERFAVAYPAGVFADSSSARSWNASAGDGVNDVQLARDVIADVGARLAVDAERIYVTGFAAGARLASRLACELADVLAAAAPVAGL